MAIELQNPVTTDPVPAKTYDEVWLHGLTVMASPNGPCRISACLERARTDEAGKKEILPGGRIVLNIPNLWADLTQDEAIVMYALINLLKARAGL